MCTDYEPSTARIGPMDSKEVVVSFYSKEDMVKPEKTPIKIFIRGGVPIEVPFFAQTRIPQIVIHEDIFNFGKMKFGNRRDLPMTIENKSSIEGEVIIDLRYENEFDSIAGL
jgi:hypothetical protein